MINIIDTFEDFKNCLKNNLNLSIEEKMQLWEKCYISKYPELEYKCKNGYEDHGYHWREIAKDMVFNRTKNDFDKMITAYKNILEIIDEINEKVGRIFNIDLDINIVLYCVFQQKLLNEEIDSRGMEWENKCKLNEDKLKKLYFAALNDNDKGTKDFFGDWF